MCLCDPGSCWSACLHRRGRLAGLGVLYLLGLPYMYGIFNLLLGKELSPLAAVQAGMLIYLPGDALKILVAVLLSKPLTKALARYR